MANFPVACEELEGWPKGHWVEGHFEGERKMKVAWSDLYAFLTALDVMPTCQWPYTTMGPPDAYAREAFPEPFGANNNTPGSQETSYEDAIVIIHVDKPIAGRAVSPTHAFDQVGIVAMSVRTDPSEVLV